MTELEERLLEEVEFWEQFVNGWNPESKGPLPEKARDSLIYAQYKMDRYLKSSSAPSQNKNGVFSDNSMARLGKQDKE